MNDYEYAQLLQEVGLINPNSPQVSQLNTDYLSKYSRNQVVAAITECLAKSPYGVKLADVAAVFNHYEVIAAEQAFNALVNSKSTSDDFIVADIKAAVTIKALYGSPQRFNERSMDSMNNDHALKTFVDRYLAVKDYETFGDEKDLCFFKGVRNGDSTPHVEFIGTYSICRELVDEIYETLPYLPKDPNAKKEVRKEPKKLPEPPLDREKQIAFMEDVMKRLGITND